MMSDPDRTPSERKAVRSVAILKLTGRNEGEPRKTLGEAIHAVFADCCEAGSAGNLEETDPVVLSALDGWLNLDIALDELPTGTRDELCVQAFTQALEDIEKLHAQVRARLSVQQIQGLLDAAILTAKELSYVADLQTGAQELLGRHETLSRRPPGRATGCPLRVPARSRSAEETTERHRGAPN